MLRTGKYYIASLSWAVLGLLIAALAPFGAIAAASACKAIAALQRSVQALVYGRARFRESPQGRAGLPRPLRAPTAHGRSQARWRMHSLTAPFLLAPCLLALTMGNKA
jgi:hypothetical protein